MRRGSTPTYTFELPFPVVNCQKIDICFAQHKKVFVQKDKSDCVLGEGNTFSLTLTQDETLLFRANECIDVQVSVLTGNGTALTSDIYHLDCVECLRNGVL